MRRRGVAYTMVAILLLLVVASLFFAHSQRSAHDAHRAVASRVLTVDEFIDNLGEDSERAAYIAGYRGLIAMEQHLTTSGEFIENPEEAFREIFLTGNLSGTQYQIMANSSFNQYLDRASEEAGYQGILVSGNVTSIALRQEDPWNVLVNYTLALNVTDSRGTASFQVVRDFVGRVPIIELRDPLYSWGTLSRVQRVVIPTNITQFVDDVGDANDTTLFIQHYNNSYYRALGRGPSFLMRFSGNFSDSEFGIESLVDIEEISAQGLTVNTTKSVVDYKYFQGLDALVCDIQNLPDEIKLDILDAQLYEVEGKLEYSNC